MEDGDSYYGLGLKAGTLAQVETLETHLHYSPPPPPPLPQSPPPPPSPPPPYDIHVHTTTEDVRVEHGVGTIKCRPPRHPTRLRLSL